MNMPISESAPLTLDFDHDPSKDTTSSGPVTVPPAPADGDYEYLFPSAESSQLTLPKMASVTKLADAFVRNGLPRHVAESVARSVSDPAAVRNRLSAVNTVRVPGATLLTVETLVFAPAVLPYPANPRAAGEWRFPAAGDESRRPLCEIGASRGSAVPELLVAADSPEHVTESLSRNAAALRSMNNYRESIALQGVLRPIVAVPLTVSHKDGTRAVTVLTAVDGSSRVTACHDLLGLEPQQPLYALGADVKRLRREVEKHTKLAGTDPTPQQLAALRALAIPATIVVGFRPAHPRVDFATAMRSLLGLIHVDPPRPWGAEGTLDTRADSVVATLVDDGFLSEEKARWLSGMLSPKEAAAAGFPAQPDERFATIVLTLLAPDLKRAVNRGFHRLTISSTAVSQNERLAVAVELGLRPVRHRINGDLLSTARSALNKALEQEGVVVQFKKQQRQKDDIWSVTQRAPDELLDAAIAELRSGSGRASRFELAILGVWWLTLQGILNRTRRFANDPRDANTLLRGMMSSEHGLRILHRAVVDGRAGLPVAVVGADGEVERSTSGSTRTLDEERLRAIVVTVDEVNTEIEAVIERTQQVQPPAERLRSASRRIVSQVEELRADVALLGEILDQDNKPIVDRYGIEPELVDQMKTHLEQVRDDLVYHGRVATNFAAAHLARLTEQ
jgi:hypothetical protein